MTDHAPTGTTRCGGLNILTSHSDQGAPITLDMLRYSYVHVEANGQVRVRLDGPYADLGYEWDYANWKLRVESGWLADTRQNGRSGGNSDV